MERKFCFIISINEFRNDKNNLPGGNKDANRSKEVFEKLGFEVRLGEKKQYNKKEEMTTNLTASEIYQEFENLSENNYIIEPGKKLLLNDISILVCIILSHGDAGIIYGSDEKAVNLDKIFGYFEGNNCKELRGKPKIFLIDACRGGEFERHVNVAGGGTSTPQLPSTLPLPNKADFLKGYATVKGYVAWMTDGFGWYIKALCEELKGLTESKDLLSILTIVNNKVSTEYVIWKKYEIWLKDPKNQDAVNKEIWKNDPKNQDVITNKIWLKDPKNQDTIKCRIWNNDPKNEVGTMYKKWLDDTNIQSTINEELEVIVQMPIFKCTLRNAVHLQLEKKP